MNRKFYTILCEDIGKTFNIKMHTYQCFATSKEEAVGEMVLDGRLNVNNMYEIRDENNQTIWYKSKQK